MYYAFGYDAYYPRGGGRDFIGFSDNLTDLIKHILSKYRGFDTVEVWGQDDEKGLVLEYRITDDEV